MRGENAERGSLCSSIEPDKSVPGRESTAAEGGVRQAVRQVIEASWFQNAIIAVIVLNAVVIGVETSPVAMRHAETLLDVLDTIAIAIFAAEILAKLYAYRWRFFASGWNLFDFVIVGSALIPAGREVSVLRALRILRAFRLISTVPKMRQVVQGLFSAIPAMGTVILLLGLIFYVAAVMATKLFGDSFPQWFGSIGGSLYTLFQIMTLDSWSMEIVRPVMDAYPIAWGFFVPFILVTSFIVLNLFIAIIVNAMHEAQDDADAAERDVILREIRGLRREIARLTAADVPPRPGARDEAEDEKREARSI